jgi:hypothetical protein
VLGKLVLAQADPDCAAASSRRQKAAG